MFSQRMYTYWVCKYPTLMYMYIIAVVLMVHVQISLTKAGVLILIVENCNYSKRYLHNVSKLLILI